MIKSKKEIFMAVGILCISALWGLLWVNVLTKGVYHGTENYKEKTQSAESAKAAETRSFKVYQSADGWTISYPYSWNRVGSNFIQDESTGKTIEFYSKNCSKNDLEKWLDEEIKRKLGATEAGNTLEEPLKMKQNGDLLYYTYTIKSKIESLEYLLKTTVIFDGEKRYEFRTSLPPVADKEYEEIINSFKIVKIINSDTNKEIVKKYISDFLTNGYSKYYIINSITSDFRQMSINDGKLEAIVFTTMNSNVPPKDPETVPYIIEVKEKAEKETDPDRKYVLQHEYETLRDEYGKPNDTNFPFKLTANLKDDTIDKKTIKLFLEQDIENSKVIYTPAEDMLPR